MSINNTYNYINIINYNNTHNYNNAYNILYRYGSVENIPRIIKELISTKIFEIIKNIEYERLSNNEKKLYNNYTIQELKKIAKKNNIDQKNIGNKSYKLNWIKALEKSKKYAFNTFVMGIKKEDKNHPLKFLNGQFDILNIIKKYIDKDNEIKSVKRNLCNEFNKINIK